MRASACNVSSLTKLQKRCQDNFLSNVSCMFEVWKEVRAVRSEPAQWHW